MDSISPDDFLDVAVRAWTDVRDEPGKPSRMLKIPDMLLVLDTETTVDELQSLMFGSAQLVKINQNAGNITGCEVLSEVIFHADTLEAVNPAGYKTLASYCADRNLTLVSRTDFAEQWLYRYCVRRVNDSGNLAGTATLTGFNLAFDMSRLAYSAGNGRGKNRGRFTLRMFPEHEDSNGKLSENRYRPRLLCESLDSKKSLMSWGSCKNRAHLEGSRDAGAFLDVRQLIWGMTNRSVSLATGCELFGLPEECRKTNPEAHGTITPEYIDYNRQDVTATAQLAVNALAEYAEHPIRLPATKVFSPASIGKAYLREMGIIPMMLRDQVPTDNELLGNITSTFYGARAEVHIRRVPVPVTVNDFTSMYCSVNTLLSHWDHITADSIKVIDVTDELRSFLTDLTVDTVLDPAVWPSFTGFAQVKPDGDILPVRAAYGDKGTEGYNVGINRLHSAKPFWYAIPDLVASTLLTGKPPNIIKAIRFVPSARKLDTLSPVRLMGNVEIDPSATDFFKEVTEQRSVVKASRTCDKRDDCTCRECRTAGFLKVLGNSSSYGIYVEMLRTASDKPEDVTVYSMDTTITTKVTAKETSREFCYPPIGSVITAGARLMLAIVERLVINLGGTWLFCDTDSMAIVTNPDGSLIPCPGGQHRMPDGTEAIKALTPAQMDHIRQQVNRLNPYNLNMLPILLKDETKDANKKTQVYGYAISAKRYTLFTYQDGKPVVPDSIDGKEAYKQHGLGAYMPPIPPDAEHTERKWVKHVWQYLLDHAHGINTPYPEWARNPALMQVSISSPHVMTTVAKLNQRKDYDASIKPFSFVLMVSELLNASFGGQNRRFIAPFTKEPEQWVTGEWHDLDNPKADPVHVTTKARINGLILVKSMCNVIDLYAMHGEAKSQTAQGIYTGGDTTGVMQRRTVRIQSVKHIGKESNDIENMSKQTVRSWSEVLTEYAPNDTKLVRDAFGDLSYRRIAQLVNAESEALYEITGYADQVANGYQSFIRIDDGHLISVPNQVETYGTAVKIDHKTVQRYMTRNAVNRVIARAIERTAAKHVNSIVNITSDEITYTSDMTPHRVLAIWHETGQSTTEDLVNTELKTTNKRLRIVTTRVDQDTKTS